MGATSKGEGARNGEAAATRERILVEASELFARRGYFGTSTRAIADAVEIRQPSLFHHFSSKREIMEALLRHNLEATVELVESLLGAGGSPARRFEEYVRFDIELVFSSPYNAVGLYRQGILELPEFAGCRRLYERLRVGRQRLIAEAIAAGEFVEIDVELADDAIGGLVLGTIGVRSRRSADPERVAQELAALAVRGLSQAGR